jgi:hypothetical protein
MLKALLLAVVFFSSCAGSSLNKPAPITDGKADKPVALLDNGHIVSGPGAGTLTVIGVSGRMRRMEQEIDRALDDAAWQIALYHGLKGKTAIVLQTGAGYRDYHLTVETEFSPKNEGDYAEYRAALRFDLRQDLVRTDEAVFLRCVYEVPGIMPVERTYKTENENPAWAYGGFAVIPGYASATGFAKNHRYLRETIGRSRESAVAALIAGVSSHIVTEVLDDSNRGAAISTVEIIEGELLNFMALETWIEPATSSVWTLAVARKTQKKIP